MTTTLTDHQRITHNLLDLTINIRYDDECGNGHNTFAITGTTPDTCGCIHDVIVRAMPELEPLIKWHLMSSDGPLHYIANAVYHAECGNLNAARRTAIWPDATLDQLQDEDALNARLPALIAEFKVAMESLGFTF